MPHRSWSQPVAPHKIEMILQYDNLSNGEAIGNSTRSVSDQQPINPDRRQQVDPAGQSLGRVPFIAVYPALQHDNTTAVAATPGNPSGMPQGSGPRQPAKLVAGHRLFTLKPLNEPPQPGSQNHPESRRRFTKTTAA